MQRGFVSRSNTQTPRRSNLFRMRPWLAKLRRVTDPRSKISAGRNEAPGLRHGGIMGQRPVSYQHGATPHVPVTNVFRSANGAAQPDGGRKRWRMTAVDGPGLQPVGSLWIGTLMFVWRE